ncbi:MAG: spermidine synthase [Acidobacteriota bacterium]|jgi:spermidine synthase|nr:spermidine synthase [Acidobacteriota bacterium]
MKIEELAYHKTDLGELILRRREEPRLQKGEVFEVKLGDEFLMSSLFTEGEKELANIGLAGLKGKLDVVVGGLGLGYTAVAALENKDVCSLLVIDKFQEVIDWHKQKLVPLGKVLSEDKRCELRQGDFFELARTGFGVSNDERKFDAVLLDIDHSPEHFLDEKNETFYRKKGLEFLQKQLKNGGVFALWSNDPPDVLFTKHLKSIFATATAHNIEFPNPYTNSTCVNSIYTATK